MRFIPISMFLTTHDLKRFNYSRNSKRFALCTVEWWHKNRKGWFSRDWQLYQTSINMSLKRGITANVLQTKVDG